MNMQTHNNQTILHMISYNRTNWVNTSCCFLSNNKATICLIFYIVILTPGLTHPHTLRCLISTLPITMWVGALFSVFCWVHMCNFRRCNDIDQLQPNWGPISMEGHQTAGFLDNPQSAYQQQSHSTYFIYSLYSSFLINRSYITGQPEFSHSSHFYFFL